MTPDRGTGTRRSRRPRTGADVTASDLTVELLRAFSAAYFCRAAATRRIRKPNRWYVRTAGTFV
ncbi:hypothetical protein Asi03nite_56930 [Actinoplanes siamensis]|uniref:Uncharacterized protein n=1 Tax=Actinoplanes siamensis TaxID=1223317 RepID=A0A919TNQ3_9ACTN|nr:hypothetical protein Asi03nite_56930 [Actinoplanes siamensis]